MLVCRETEKNLEYFKKEKRQQRKTKVGLALGISQKGLVIPNKQWVGEERG